MSFRSLSSLLPRFDHSGDGVLAKNEASVSVGICGCCHFASLRENMLKSVTEM